MTEIQKTKRFYFEDRTLKFAKATIELINTIPQSLANTEIAKQIIRSSSSVGANYIEANESFSKKDFLLRTKICRKEAKETRYWLSLISVDEDNEIRRQSLHDEATDLTKIFGAIVDKTENSQS